MTEILATKRDPDIPEVADAAWLKRVSEVNIVEVWVTSLYDGQLVYECHSVHQTFAEARIAATAERDAVRTLLVELKHEGKVLWAAAGIRHGRAIGYRRKHTMTRRKDSDD